jgi:hypothetical protein
MKAEEFDKKFDNGEDISQYLNFDNAKRPRRQQSIKINLPDWMIQQLRQQAQQRGTSTDTLIENYLAQHLSPLN